MTQAVYTPAQAENQNLKRSGLIWLGIILLAAFFMPMVQPDFSAKSRRSGGGQGYQLTFPNIEVVTSEADIPPMVRFGAAFPAAAGVLIIVAAAAMPKLVCSLMVTGTGAFAYIMTITDEGMRNALSVLPREADRIIIIYVLILAGLTGLLAGCLAKRHRPGSSLASIMGILGGLMFLGGLFLPVMPKASGACLAMTTLELLRMKQGMAVATGAMLSLGMLLWAIAAIISFFNIPGRRDGPARSMGSSAYACMVIGATTLLLAFLVTTFSSVRGETQILMVAAVSVKTLLWIIGVFLILPMGLAGVAISLSSAAAIAPPPSLVTTPGAHISQDRLQELLGLYERGMITRQEYEEQRSRIISSL